MNIFGGLIFIGLGIVLLKFSYQIVKMTGPMPWIERYFGSTYTFVKVLGIVLAFFGFVRIFGAEGGIVSFLFGWVQRGG